MFLIRSIARAQSGRRDEAVALMKSLSAETAKELGQPEARILTGSVGIADSTVVMERVVKSLAEFEEHLDKMNKWPGMAKYGPKFGELFISGSHHFEIYRVA
jgi:sugar phosphate isomerase/epimerase